jgi:hypothetical protein
LAWSTASWPSRRSKPASMASRQSPGKGPFSSPEPRYEPLCQVGVQAQLGWPTQVIQVVNRTEAFRWQRVLRAIRPKTVQARGNQHTLQAHTHEDCYSRLPHAGWLAAAPAIPRCEGRPRQTLATGRAFNGGKPTGPAFGGLGQPT